MSIGDAPSTCRSCAFLVKCFGMNDEAVARSTVLPCKWSSYPLRLGRSLLRVLSHGERGGPVVFIHAEGGSADRFAFNLHAFARAGHRAYAFDLPGHGLSSKLADGPTSVPDHAELVAAFLEQLGEPAMLVGVSVGAHIAAYCAARHPALVEALVMVGGGGLIPMGADHRDRLRRLMTYRSPEGGRERLRRALFDPRLAGGDIVEEEFRMNTSPGASQALRVFGDYVADRLDEDVVGRELRAVAGDVRCLVVWGTEDNILPEAFGRASCETLGDACGFATIGKTGHAPHFERPGEFNQLLLKFLRGSARPFEGGTPLLVRESAA